MLPIFSERERKSGEGSRLTSPPPPGDKEEKRYSQPPPTKTPLFLISKRGRFSLGRKGSCRLRPLSYIFSQGGGEKRGKRGEGRHQSLHSYSYQALDRKRGRRAKEETEKRTTPHLLFTSPFILWGRKKKRPSVFFAERGDHRKGGRKMTATLPFLFQYSSNGGRERRKKEIRHSSRSLREEEEVSGKRRKKRIAADSLFFSNREKEGKEEKTIAFLTFSNVQGEKSSY